MSAEVGAEPSDRVFGWRYVAVTRHFSVAHGFTREDRRLAKRLSRSNSTAANLDTFATVAHISQFCCSSQLSALDSNSSFRPHQLSHKQLEEHQTAVICCRSSRVLMSSNSLLKSLSGSLSLRLCCAAVVRCPGASAAFVVACVFCVRKQRSFSHPRPRTHLPCICHAAVLWHTRHPSGCDVQAG